MGKLIYGSDGYSFDIDDRTLAHLRVVFMNKLRRAEPFFFHHPETVGSRNPALNRAWIETLLHDASGPHGLAVGPEPAETAPAEG